MVIISTITVRGDLKLIEWFSQDDLMPVLQISIGKGYLNLYKGTYTYLQNPSHIKFGANKDSLIIGLKNQNNALSEKVYYGRKIGKVCIKRYEQVFKDKFDININQSIMVYEVNYDKNNNCLELTKENIQAGKLKFKSEAV